MPGADRVAVACAHTNAMKLAVVRMGRVVGKRVLVAKFGGDLRKNSFKLAILAPHHVFRYGIGHAAAVAGKSVQDIHVDNVAACYPADAERIDEVPRWRDTQRIK